MPVQILSVVALISFIVSFVCWIMAMNRRTSDDPIFNARIMFKVFRREWFTPTGFKLWVTAHIAFWLFTILVFVQFAIF